MRFTSLLDCGCIPTSFGDYVRYVMNSTSEPVPPLSALKFIGATMLIAAWVTYSMYLVFMVVPNEVTMGAVQRIFYFHVGSAFATYAATGCLLIGALGFLALKKDSLDYLQLAAAEVGLLFCSIVLVTGMIWAQSAWNLAFSFREPRLVSTLVLWLLFVALVVLRRFAAAHDAANYCAAFGVLGAILVPVVVFSVKFLSPVGQLHPVVVEHGGLREASFREAFWITNGAIVSMALLLVWVRQRIALWERRTLEKRAVSGERI